MSMTLMLLTAQTSALAVPEPEIPSVAGSVVLGRKNPFRPLIGARRVEPGIPPLSAAPPLPTIALPSAAPRSQSDLADVEFRGVAYDDDEALAAMRIAGQLRLLRVGDRVAGATLVSIASDRIVLRKNGRLLTKRLPTS
ncbi:hypothetical protein J7643_05300 [bacterium]|nr:hypothetical protein [bacterium]